MAVGIRVGAVVRLLGDGPFVTAFFHTVSGNLEPDGWGTRFPTTTGPFYEGLVPNDRVPDLRRELALIRSELATHPPQDLVWDLEDADARPPWGDDIAPTITDLGNYFVTMDGQDMFDTLDESLEHAERSGQEVSLTSVGPVGPPPGHAMP